MVPGHHARAGSKTATCKAARESPGETLDMDLPGAVYHAGVRDSGLSDLAPSPLSPAVTSAAPKLD